MAQLNFKEIEAYPVDIESFNYNVSDMVDSIYIGPQGELLEKIDDFNGKFGSNIGVTKNFTLKPGGYDSIKSAYDRWVLRYDLKPRGISSLFNRIRDYDWRKSQFRVDLLRIEEKMKNLKASGLRWQDNADDLVIELDKMKENIANGIEKVKELYPDVDVSVKVLPTEVNRLSLEQRRRSYGRQTFPDIAADDANNVTDFIVTYYIHMHNVMMSTHILNEDETINTYDTPCGDIIVVSGSYLLPMISRNWGNTESSSDMVTGGQYSYFLDVVHLDEMKLNRHPYIGTSTDKYAWDLDAKIYSFNICQGNMAPDIKSTMINGQVEAHITHIVTWLTNYYVPQTNPLNRIHMLKYVGKNKLHSGFNEESRNNNVFNRERLENWQDCPLPNRISGTIFEYGTDDCTNYGHLHNRIRVDSVSYCERVHDYLNRIDLNDMPCNECVFQPECEISQIIFMMLKDDAFTPEEEGYVGMFLEWNRRDQIQHNSRKIHFVEEAITLAGFYKMAEQYDKVIMEKLPVDPVVAEAFEEALESHPATIFVEEEESHILETLTPEQRTIQWASRQGGATNL